MSQESDAYLKGVGGGAASGAAAGSVAGPWGTAIGAVVGAGLGAYQTYQGQKGLKELAKQQMPQYTISPEQQQYYDVVKNRAQYGFDPNEIAAFKQNVAQQQNTGFQQGVQMAGGNLAQAISNGLGAQKLNSFNQFAAQDSQQKRENIGLWGQSVGAMQGQNNLINEQRIQHRYRQEQAYGGALQAGLSNIASSAQGAAALYGSYGKSGGSKGIGSGGGQSFGDMVDNDINSGYFGDSNLGGY